MIYKIIAVLQRKLIIHVYWIKIPIESFKYKVQVQLCIELMELLSKLHTKVYIVTEKVFLVK